MKTFKAISFIVGISVLGGCVGTPPIDTETAIKISKIQVVKAKNADKLYNYDTIQPVEGISCQRTAFGTPPSLASAVNQLKIKAADVGGNAVIVSACSNTGVEWLKNCSSSITCQGSAIKIKNNKFDQCTKDLAVSSELDIIKNKVPISAPVTFSMLSDESKPSKEERDVLRQWGDKRGVCFQKKAKIIKDVLSQEFANLYLHSITASQAALTELVNGKITYSEFAKKHTALESNYRENYAKLVEKTKAQISEERSNTIRAAQEQQRINIEQQRATSAQDAQRQRQLNQSLQLMMGGGGSTGGNSNLGSPQELINCGIKPIPPIGYRIGRCVNGQWEMISQ